jgi:hypothetical protein
MVTLLPKEENPGGKGPRVVVRLSTDMQFLLTLVAQHLRRNKKEIHDAIWAAGLKEVLGLCEEDLDDITITSLPRGVQPPRDTKRLVQALIRER